MSVTRKILLTLCLIILGVFAIAAEERAKPWQVWCIEGDVTPMADWLNNGHITTVIPMSPRYRQRSSCVIVK